MKIKAENLQNISDARYKEILKIIKTTRRERGISCRAMAFLTGVGVDARGYRLLESGLQPLDMGLLTMICLILDIDMYDVFSDIFVKDNKDEVVEKEKPELIRKLRDPNVCYYCGVKPTRLRVG